VGRAFFFVALLCTCHAAAAAECGPRVAYVVLERLGGELQRELPGLTAYAESLASRPEANGVSHLAQELYLKAMLGNNGS